MPWVATKKPPAPPAAAASVSETKRLRSRTTGTGGFVGEGSGDLDMRWEPLGVGLTDVMSLSTQLALTSRVSDKTEPVLRNSTHGNDSSCHEAHP